MCPFLSRKAIFFCILGPVGTLYLWLRHSGLLLVPSDALGYTWALPGVLGAGQGVCPPKVARGTLTPLYRLRLYPFFKPRPASGDDSRSDRPRAEPMHEGVCRSQWRQFFTVLLSPIRRFGAFLFELDFDVNRFF